MQAFEGAEHARGSDGADLMVGHDPNGGKRVSEHTHLVFHYLIVEPIGREVCIDQQIQL
jgi:hypothetical protein